MLVKAYLSEFDVNAKVEALVFVSEEVVQRQIDSYRRILMKFLRKIENGEWLLKLCNEKKLVVRNTWFKKKRSLWHKYTWERADQNIQKKLVRLC